MSVIFSDFLLSNEMSEYTENISTSIFIVGTCIILVIQVVQSIQEQYG